MDGIRSFVAIPLPPAVRNRVARLQRELKVGLPQESRFRASGVQNLHLTLIFLGDQPAEMLTRIATLMQSTGLSIMPFEVALKGIGTFPAAKSPRVVWLGVEPQGKLQRLYNALAGGLVELGLPAEKRAYRPHLTLGRLRGSNSPEEALNPFRERDSGPLKVSRMVLFRSRLLPGGAEHLPLCEVELGQSGEADC